MGRRGDPTPPPLLWLWGLWVRREAARAAGRLERVSVDRLAELEAQVAEQRVVIVRLRAALAADPDRHARFMDHLLGASQPHT